MILVGLLSITELFLAELVFMFGFPKRRYFAVRLIAAILIAEAVAAGLWFLEQLANDNQALMFLLLLVKIVITIFLMLACFKGSPWAVVSACVGGVAIQHVGYQLSVLVSRLFFPWLIEGSEIGAGVYYIELACCLVVCLITFFVFGIPLAKHPYYEHFDKRMIAVAVIIVLVCIGIIRFYRDYAFGELGLVVSVCIYSIVCNLLALFFMFFLTYFATLRNNYLMLRRLHDEEARQYEQSKVNNKLLNIKCHDLKHYVRAFGNTLPEDEVESLKRIIDIYDSTYKSDVEVFDVIINEKIVQCVSRGITLTIMGDAKNISFMNTMDIYSLFGNMIENAMDAVQMLPDPKTRAISIVLEKRGDLVYINSVNYTNQNYVYEDGLPKTTKGKEPGFHGYGMQSMRMIAEKYGGGLCVNVEDGVFSLNVYMFPQQSGQAELQSE